MYAERFIKAFIAIIIGIIVTILIAKGILIGTGHSINIAKVESATVVSTTKESHALGKTKYIVVVQNDKTGDVKTLADTRPVNSAYHKGDRVDVSYIGAAPQLIK